MVYRVFSIKISEKKEYFLNSFVRQNQWAYILYFSQVSADKYNEFTSYILANYVLTNIISLQVMF